MRLNRRSFFGVASAALAALRWAPEKLAKAAPVTLPAAPPVAVTYPTGNWMDFACNEPIRTGTVVMLNNDGYAVPYRPESGWGPIGVAWSHPPEKGNAGCDLVRVAFTV